MAGGLLLLLLSGLVVELLLHVVQHVDQSLLLSLTSEDRLAFSWVCLTLLSNEVNSVLRCFDVDLSVLRSKLFKAPEEKSESAKTVTACLMCVEWLRKLLILKLILKRVSVVIS